MIGLTLQTVALLKSLDFEGRHNREDQLWEVRADIETVQWLWKSSFANWASGSGGFFWICGKPGSGKSTLMECVARSDKLKDDLRRSISEEWTIIHHFFFGFGVSKDIRNNFEGFLRSLLYQLIQKSSEADKSPKAVNLQGTGREQQWSMRALQERLANVLKQRRSPICILVDGLDEYQDNKWELARFLREMASSRVKLCVASRPDQVLNIAFKNVPTIKMQEWNTPGIGKMVTLSIERDVAESGFYNDNEVVKLAIGISKKAQGVFLWARFAVNELRNGWSMGLDLAELQMRLEKVPEELEDICARIFRKLEPKQKREVAYLLQLVCYAKRTLTLDELYIALAHAPGGQGPIPKEITELAIQRFERKILAVTEGVLEVFRGRELNDSQENTYSKSDESQEYDYSAFHEASRESRARDKLHVNVIHRTVRTYLDSNGWPQLLGAAHEGMLHAEVLWLRICTELFPPSFKEIPSFPEQPTFDGHESMLRRVRAALNPTKPLSPDRQLSLTEPLDIDQRSDKGDGLSQLLEYAAMYMLHHAVEVEQGLGLASYNILQQGISNSFMCYHRFYWINRKRKCTCYDNLLDPLHPFHLAIAHGLDGYVKDFLSSKCNNTEPGSRDWDDFFYLDVDHHRGFDSLRDAGPFRMSVLEFAIHHARKFGRNDASQTHIVALLLEHYSHVHDAEMILALQTASAEVVKLLLRRCPKGKMVLRSNTLQSDRFLKGEMMLGHLFEFSLKRLDVGPMWYIARRSSICIENDAELVDLFLRRGEDINDQCSPFGTALHGAVIHLLQPRPELDTFELLFAKGANINASGPLGTPLEFLWRVANTRIFYSILDFKPIVEGIEWLIRHGAVNNRCDPNGSVPSREQMLSFGKSGMNEILKSQRLYRGDPPIEKTGFDSTHAEVGSESFSSNECEYGSSSDL